jgi:hypothetical protein
MFFISWKKYFKKYRGSNFPQLTSLPEAATPAATGQATDARIHLRPIASKQARNKVQSFLKENRMLNPEDTDQLFNEESTLIGHITTDSGGLLLTDSIWQDVIPKVKDQIIIQLDVPPRQRIPVRALRKDGKRYLLIAIDEAQESKLTAEMVEVE